MKALRVMVLASVLAAALMPMTAQAKSRSGKQKKQAATPQASTTQNLGQTPLAVADTPSSGSVTSGDPSLTRTVLLLGERVQWSAGSGKGKAPAENIAAKAGAILGARIVDETSASETVAQTLSHAQKLGAVKANAIIVFTGAADEKAQTPESAHVDGLTSLSHVLRKSGAPVFVIPSSPSINAGTSANLRITATISNMTFIEPGTEISGRPYEEALEQVQQAELRAATAHAKPTPLPQRLMPEAPAASSVSEASLSSNTAPLAVQPPVPDNSTTGAQLVKTGAPQEPVTGYIKPAPPLKRFDPREEVKRRKQKNAKKPAFER